MVKSGGNGTEKVVLQSFFGEIIVVKAGLDRYIFSLSASQISKA